jgi:hypothetical protein
MTVSDLSHNSWERTVSSEAGYWENPRYRTRVQIVLVHLDEYSMHLFESASGIWID